MAHLQWYSRKAPHSCKHFHRATYTQWPHRRSPCNFDKDPGLFTNDAVLHIHHIVGVEEKEMQGNVEIFPVPNDGQFTIRSADGPISQFTVTDMAGRVVQASTHRQPHVEVDMRGQAAGGYAIRLQVGKQWVSRRILVE
jgi:Secretion system C-terminal sorting domain